MGHFTLRCTNSRKRGWLRSQWKVGDTGHRSKFYALTRLGRRQLEKEAANWDRLSTAISQVIRMDEA